MTPTAALSALVAELRKLDEAATPGPWKVGARPFKCEGAGPFPCEAGGCPVCGGGVDPDEYRLCPDDVAFIVAMRNALPQLLAAAEERDALREVLGDAAIALDEMCLSLERNGHPSTVTRSILARVEKALGRGT